MNGIVERQNSSPFLRLLRARAHIYMGAGRIQWIQFALSVVVPMIGAIAGIIWVETRPWIGVLALAITIYDVSWLDGMQRRKLGTLAKVAEQFDCELLGLPWNAFTVGKYVDPETIDAAASGWSGGDAYLMDWYPQQVGAVVPHLACIICQQANLWYDSKLRRMYSTFLVAGAMAIFGALFVIGIILRLSVEDFAVTILTPSAPMIIWSIREYYGHRDAAEANEIIKAEVEAFWDRAASGAFLEDACALRSRELQDAIYVRRSSNPLLFPFILTGLRTSMLGRLTIGIAELVKQAGGNN
jgi:hypothetical protein